MASIKTIFYWTYTHLFYKGDGTDIVCVGFRLAGWIIPSHSTFGPYGKDGCEDGGGTGSNEDSVSDPHAEDIVRDSTAPLQGMEYLECILTWGS